MEMRLTQAGHSLWCLSDRAGECPAVALKNHAGKGLTASISNHDSSKAAGLVEDWIPEESSCCSVQAVMWTDRTGRCGEVSLSEAEACGRREAASFVQKERSGVQRSADLLQRTHSDRHQGRR
ncbi:hypothetical protein AAFF_G00208850 [Aldrovandia affinis]|uniref:Uncharacterized protein n=1 Tax=Aldrovandia affinis TaxID=143900 RepID=A0AAD7RH55_9TELE|nr:hypothetical protein AAFF_G00208850 [Aldrovandia affinis]